MSNPGRPLSPHLSVYRWPITMGLSILHRITGVAMSAGLVVFAWWLIAAAQGAEAYGVFIGLMDSMPGRLLLIGWSYAFFYHLANGIRHLFWDAGIGFEKRQADLSSWVVIVVSVVMTLALWLLA